MNKGNLRNLGIIGGSLLAAIGFACLFNVLSVPSRIQKVTMEMWPLQGLVAGAVLTLIYRLISDTTAVSALTSPQRRTLDEMVSKKLHRLWGLIALVALPVLLIRISDQFVNKNVENALVATALTFVIWSTILCVYYLPRMWRELRSFVVQLIMEGEISKRRVDALTRLSTAHQTFLDEQKKKD